MNLEIATAACFFLEEAGGRESERTEPGREITEPRRPGKWISETTPHLSRRLPLGSHGWHADGTGPGSLR